MQWGKTHKLIQDCHKSKLKKNKTNGRSCIEAFKKTKGK